jgi:cytochrome c
MVSKHWILAISALAAVLAGCGDNSSSGDTAPAADTSAAAEAGSSYDLDALLATADPDRGRRLFLQCRACHSVEEGGDHKIGPNLWDLFGSEAGKKPEFAYSEALANSGLTWAPDKLDQWMARPSQFIPNNQMVFVGIRKPEDRANLIAYLQQVTTPQAE